MDKYLLEILKLINTIIIPGLGALTITNPETGEILFMSYLKHDDGKLSAHIAEKEGWDENEAKNLIAKYVREIHAELDKGEEYAMYQFGTFVKKDGEIEFVRWGEKVENEYIPPIVEEKTEDEPTKENPKVVQLKEEPVKEEKEEPVLPISDAIPGNNQGLETPKELNILEKEEQEATAAKLVVLQEIQDSKNQKKKKGVGFWVGIGLLVLLIGGGTYVGLNYDHIKKQLPFLADNNSTEAEETTFEEEQIPEEEINDSEDFEEISEEYNTEDTEAYPEETIEEIDDVTEPIEETITETANTNFSSELPYQIIAGAFSEEANAIRLVDKLKSEGYPALQMQKGSKFMVSVKSFASRENAQSELSSIKEVAPGGWITKW